MKISSVIAPAILVASAQAQSWCQDALNGCFKEVNELRNTLDSHLAYKPVTCPGHKNGNARASGDEVYKIYCDRRHSGGIIGPKPAATLEECMHECDIGHGCVAADWYASTNTCNLKSSGTSAESLTNGPGVVAFYLAAYL